MSSDLSEEFAESLRHFGDAVQSSGLEFEDTVQLPPVRRTLPQANSYRDVPKTVGSSRKLQLTLQGSPGAHPFSIPPILGEFTPELPEFIAASE